MIDSIEGTYDTLPVIRTFPRESRSFVLVIRAKVNHSLCSIPDTLVGDSDGIYHPALFKDRLVLGLKGIMAEAELHILRARLEGGIRNKAARGELRRGLPVGFVWGEQDGEVCFHPDESVVSTVRTAFSKFTELGSVRKVWLWFRSEDLSFPLRPMAMTEADDPALNASASPLKA